MIRRLLHTSGVLDCNLWLFLLFLESIWILLVAPLLFLTIVVPALVCCYIKKNPSKRKSIMLPKSLVMHLIVYLIIDASC